METDKFYDILMNLDGNWKVVGTRADVREKEIEIYVEYIGSMGEDPETGAQCKLYDLRESRRWRRLDTLQYKTFINCRVPRVKAASGEVKTIRVPWSDGYERFTTLFESHVIDLLLATKNRSQTAALVDCGFNVVNRILHRATGRGLEARPKNSVIHHISIDEKSFKRGHEYVTVLSRPHLGCIPEVSEGRDKGSCNRLIENALNEEQVAGIRTVSMDMWKPYINMASERFPKAEVVHDKFHLVKYLSEAIDKVRRRESKTHSELKNSRYALLKNVMNLTEKQRIKFEAIRDGNYEVAKAWGVRENFRALFAENSKEEAFILFSQWCSHAVRTGVNEINKVVDTFKNHISGVINAMVKNLNNAMAERLNGKIQELKTIGKGYRKFENFRSAILFFHGQLNLYPQHSW